MAKYSQAKQFRFTGYVTFKKENLLKDKQGSTWRKISFGITDEQGNNTHYVECSEFGAGNSFKVKTRIEKNMIIHLTKRLENMELKILKLKF